MVRDDVRRLHNAVGRWTVTARNHKVQSVAVAKGCFVDRLCEIERLQDVIEPTYLLVGGVVHMEAEVATDDNLAAICSDDLEQLRQFFEEQLRWRLTS